VDTVPEFAEVEYSEPEALESMIDSTAVDDAGIKRNDGGVEVAKKLTVTGRV
jgi:hypothetical protein